RLWLGATSADANPAAALLDCACSIAADESGGRTGGDANFDRYASPYQELHAKSIRASGEPTAYFAQYKVDCLIRMGAAEPILDFGCGIGNLIERLVVPFRDVHGYDPSAASLSIARARAASAKFHDKVESISDA